MFDGTEPIVKGSVFEWNGTVNARANRVSQKWADFTMTQGGSSWGKRMPLPLGPAFVRVS